MRWLLCGLLEFALWAQSPGPISIVALRARIASLVRGMPNYTCTQTIGRWSGGTLVDRIRLEVAVIDGRENFALPGASVFEQTEAASLAPPGVSASGDYVGFLRALASPATPLSEDGVQIRDGRRLLRYAFECPAPNGLLLREGEREVRAGVKGLLWLDGETLDPVRLEAQAVMPPHLGFPTQAAAATIDYHRVRIGDSEFVLPARSEWTSRRKDGSRRNRTEYAACRQYGAMSAIRFEEADEPAAVAARIEARRTSATLPPALRLEVGLIQPLDFSTAAAGDIVEARVQRPVMNDGRLVLAKGGEVRGRIVRIDLRRKKAAIRFFEIRSGEAVFPFDGTVEDVGAGTLSFRLVTGPLGAAQPF